MKSFAFLKNSLVNKSFGRNGLKLRLNQKYFTGVTTTSNIQQSGVKKTFGGLKDSDRIFTNVYRDGDPFIEGALKRVINLKLLN
jgi:hypothetical protein